MRCSGRNNFGQLGVGPGDSPTPMSPIQFTQGAGVTTGGFHSCAVMRNGTVQCWGMNDFGQLGNGSTAQSTWGDRGRRRLVSEPRGDCDVHHASSVMASTRLKFTRR